jgi:hypothetical protein
MSPATVSNQPKVVVRDADRACLVVHLSEEQYRPVESLRFVKFIEPVRRTTRVVTLRPRTFEETSRHIRRLVVPIEWPAGG